MAFPTITAVVDNFNRTADPLGSAWTIWYSGRELRADGTKALASATGSGDGRDYWNVVMASADCEARCTIVSLPTVEHSFYLGLRLDNGGASAKNGYFCEFRYHPDGNMHLSIYRTDAGSTVLISAPDVNSGIAAASVTDIGFEIIGSALKAYLKSSGSWSNVSGANCTDSTYGAAGRPGLAMYDNAAVDDFIAGPYTSAFSAQLDSVAYVWSPTALTGTYSGGVHSSAQLDSVAYVWTPSVLRFEKGIVLDPVAFTFTPTDLTGTWTPFGSGPATKAGGLVSRAILNKSLLGRALVG